MTIETPKSFLNFLPHGPLAYLYNSYETIISYQDYNDSVTVVPQPFREKLILSYIQPEGGDFGAILQILSIFNTLNEELHIYCSEEVMVQAKLYSNEHIAYHDINARDIKLETNVIITYGLGALYFIKQSIPVFILGPKGLGGWVEPNTFPFLIKSGFMGRAGGTLWEHVPITIFKEELLGLRTCKTFFEKLQKNRILSESLDFIPASQLEVNIKRMTNSRNQLLVDSERWSRIPIIASNIYSVSDTSTLYFRRYYLNDTIVSVDVENAVFFKHINGTHTFRALFELLGTDETDFWEMMKILIDKKVIVVKYAVL